MVAFQYYDSKTGLSSNACESVLHTINSYAFSYTLNNHTDPFFINLRIKTNNPAVYDKIATGILENIDKGNRIDWFDGNATNHNALGNLNEF